jgi:hypothetical protein
MENAKNTFYVTLRNRLAVINPTRTVVVRGVVRPGILVEENELVSAVLPPDVFVLRWGKMAVDAEQPLTTAAMSCEVVYATDGNADNAGMDRGRMLATMDSELRKMLMPHHALKMNYSTTPAVPMETNIFWGDAAYEPMARPATQLERLQRVATVTVYSLEEPGE